MAFKLTKQENMQRDECVASLELRSVEVSTAITEGNKAIEAANIAINAKIAAYNEALGKARELAEGIASRLADEHSEKSDKWQDSHNGQAADAMASEWDDLDLEDVDAVKVERVEDFDLSHSEDLQNLPDIAE